MKQQGVPSTTISEAGNGDSVCGRKSEQSLADQVLELKQYACGNGAGSEQQGSAGIEGIKERRIAGHPHQEL